MKFINAYRYIRGDCTKNVLLKWTYIQKCLEVTIIKDKIWADGVLGEITLTDF